MLELEHILKILKKYGFYSLDRAPFVYQKDGKCGVCFAWSTIHYGNLERVLFFDTEEALEEEVYKYYWYLNNKKNYDIEVCFDNYETMSPQVIYKYKDIELDMTMMKNFLNEEFFILDESVMLKRKQLMRTANILIDILQKKYDKQNDVYLKVSELYKEYKKLEEDISNKLNDGNILNNSDLCEVLNDETENFFESLINELNSLEDEEKVEDFITKMVKLLNEIDLNEDHLKNTYLLELYPYKIEDEKKKLVVLENALGNKKKKNKLKVNVEEQLKLVEINSDSNKLKNFSDYVSDIKKSINEKYIKYYQISNIDIGDSIVNGESLDIVLPEKVKNEQVSYVDNQQLIEQLKSTYEQLNDNEKIACHVATSFLGECLNYLSEIENVNELGINDILKLLENKNLIKKFDEAFKSLDNYLNTNIRLKYLNLVKIDSFENFIMSLVKILYILTQLNTKLEVAFKGYCDYQDKEIIFIHLKMFGYLNKEKCFITEVMPNVLVNYSPIQIVKPVDILDNKELEVKDNNVIFVLRRNIKIDNSKNVKKIVHFEKDKIINKQNYDIITDMKIKGTCTYYEDKIYSFESEGI